MIPVQHVTHGDPGTSDLRVWFPAIRAGSGGDVFVERIATGLARHGVASVISWLPHLTEFVPDLLRTIEPPVAVDIVHVNSGNGFAFGREGMPLVVTEHHYLLDPEYRPYKSGLQHLYHTLLMGPYIRRSFDLADVILTGSRFTADVLKHCTGRQAEVIPYWIDYGVFSLGVALEDSAGDRPFRLLFVGNMSTRKGGDVIGPLAERLGDRFQLRCTAGMRQQVAVGLPANVEVLGRLTEAELVQAYRDCDAVLVPSRYEGFGYSALEALACEKPVVGFRSGAIAELVRDGEDAVLVDIDDIESLAAACRRLSADRDVCRRMGALGRSRVVQAYSEDKAMAAYIATYRRLLAD